MSDTQSSGLWGSGSVMYITRFPSGEMTGWDASSDTMSVDSFERTWYAVRNPEDLPVHKVNPFSSWVWHGRVVRSCSKSNLRQTPVLQAVLPDVRQPVYRPAEQQGFSWFGPHDAGFACPDISPKSTASWLVKFIL